MQEETHGTTTESDLLGNLVLEAMRVPEAPPPSHDRLAERCLLSRTALTRLPIDSASFSAIATIRPKMAWPIPVEVSTWSSTHIRIAPACCKSAAIRNAVVTRRARRSSFQTQMASKAGLWRPSLMRSNWGRSFLRL